MTVIYEHERTEAARIFDTCFDYKFREKDVCTQLVNDAVKSHPVFTTCDNSHIASNSPTTVGLALSIGKSLALSKIDRIFDNPEIDPALLAPGQQILLTKQQTPSLCGVYSVERDESEDLYIDPKLPTIYDEPKCRKIRHIEIRSVRNPGIFKHTTFEEFMGIATKPTMDANTKRTDSTKQNKTYLTQKPCGEVFLENPCREFVRFEGYEEPPLNRAGYDPLPADHPYKAKYPSLVEHKTATTSYIPTDTTEPVAVCSNRSYSEMEWIDTQFKRYLAAMDDNFRALYEKTIVKSLEEFLKVNIDIYYTTKIRLMKIPNGNFVYQEFPFDYLPVD